MRQRLKILLPILGVVLLVLGGLLYYRYVYYPTLGVIGVATEPEGATVILGGQEEGVTPLEVFRGTGTHTLVLEKDGYQSFETEVVVEGGHHQVLGYVLMKE
ncbi:PEGA domain-containing protein [Patescibacteria group bacterium]|nr:PEGA domain-containing protein [Patescibacteria group bacterium]